jgi:hypothetical protein
MCSWEMFRIGIAHIGLRFQDAQEHKRNQMD